MVKTFKYKGEMRTIRELAEIAVVTYATMRARLVKLNWTLEKAMNFDSVKKENNPNYKHGLHGHYLYVTWVHMRGRCNRKNNINYKRYGGRDLSVCEKWNSSFTEFLKDVGDRPGPSYTLDRRDNDKGYFPSNVRWATKSEQARNSRGDIGAASVYKGVSRSNSGKKWCAGIRLNGKQVYLGSYDREAEAALSYNKAAYENWGSDAYLNKIEDDL